MLLPPPIVVSVDASDAHATVVLPWAPYVSPAATWSAMPVLVAWASAPPTPLLPEEAVAALDVASRAWSVPACSAASFTIDPTRTISGDPGMNGTNDVVVHTTDWPPPLATGAAAHTVLFTSGDRIVEADIHVNARDYAFTLGAAPPAIDLRSVLTHELGHVIGIGHSEVPRATMSATLPAGIAARSLEPDDVTAVCALYPGKDTAPHGCATHACPSGYACIGFECETSGEPGTTGAPCVATGRPCDGAGDTAICRATSVGDRCAPPCVNGACGVALACAGDDPRCIPQGASLPSDAGANGADATNDATSDAGTSPAAASGCGCAMATREPDAPSVLLVGLFFVARRRRRERL